ncbi:LysR family transcriptional regulator, partial [Escherichia coli]|uniref:LysR family transcriptional regulator n=2 Tax=Enterobacteriaceae TaxID=543 RepID=UPI002F2D7758
PLNWLRAFEAAARLSSFSRAADELCVSHSAVIQQIRKLEDWCGIPLFLRVGSGVKVTGAGINLFRELNRDFERLADIFDTMRLKPTSGQLRIAVIPSIATRLLIPGIQEFKLVHPGISLSISYATAGHDV